MSNIQLLENFMGMVNERMGDVKDEDSARKLIITISKMARDLTFSAEGLSNYHRFPELVEEIDDVNRCNYEYELTTEQYNKIMDKYFASNDSSNTDILYEIIEKVVASE